MKKTCPQHLDRHDPVARRLSSHFHKRAHPSCNVAGLKTSLLYTERKESV